jgi:hypothetical protein
MRASAEPGSAPKGLPGRAASFLRGSRPQWVAALGLVLVLVAAGIDYATGAEFGPLIFYVLPVALVGSAGRADLAAGIAVAAGVSWFAVEAVAGRTYSSEWILVWNAAIRLGVFLIIGLLVAARARSRAFEAQIVAAAGGVAAPPCPYCGSKDTLRLARNLVCRSCQRLADLEGRAAAG